MGKGTGLKTFFKSSSTLRATVLFTRFCAVVPPPISEKRATVCLKGLANTSAALTVTRMRFLTSKEKKQKASEDLGKQTPTAMDEAIKALATVERASHCSGQLFPKVICHEEDFKLRKLKEGLFIRHHEVISRDKGKEVSDVWTNLITRKQLCKTMN
ncbi:hypothetical protein M514_02507 [Trichuris suis]|uniref:Uncharacterized protein n=1 Tax=Trichuris suis TaxID=68888 RepID=A0A085NFD8_9BILA|nr:hypothetical protein M514_19660 [Trichuris suis]KFD68184.1 hypothetical protein M514_02507 [Trichuris suis]